ncbi:MAG: hypothetical protein CM1200mP32_09640 [Methanobacteriota archaeon]|nr:MAG: hypothetical protein CM1200mP32_09640 [Euryarchaeota archaeon]
MATISSEKAPDSRAAAALVWLSIANASWASRPMSCLLERFSAVTPIEVIASSARLGFGKGLNPVIGTRDMLSTPPAMNASPCPELMRAAASWIDCIEEPQKRLMVTPGTVSGRSVRNVMILARL